MWNESSDTDWAASQIWLEKTCSSFNMIHTLHSVCIDKNQESTYELRFQLK